MPRRHTKHIINMVKNVKFGGKVLKGVRTRASQRLQIFYLIVLHKQIVAIFMQKIVTILAHIYKYIQNLQTLQGYIFHTSHSILAPNFVILLILLCSF